jgi:TonB family protein
VFQRAKLFSAALIGAIGAVAARGDPAQSSEVYDFCSLAREHVRYDFIRYDFLSPSSAPSGFSRAEPYLILGERVTRVSQRTGMEGTVRLGLVINSVGRVAYVQVVEKSTFSKLDDEAVAILQGAEFRPATLSSRPVRSCEILKVTFKLARD